MYQRHNELCFGTFYYIYIYIYVFGGDIVEVWTGIYCDWRTALVIVNGVLNSQ